jgi:hypothetical protein
VDGNQNIETGKPATDDIAASEQDTVPINTPAPASLENQPPLSETTPPQTEPPMEVHHHAHTALKKWNHYLWEFIMLFLAVFCGFLAENIRERYIERHKEKDYIISLVKDLQHDSAQFSYHIGILEKKMPYIESTLQFLDKANSYNNQLPVNTWLTAINEIYYRPVEPTIQQLKNSGNLRLIENKKVLDSILIYDSWLIGPYNDQIHFVYEYQQRVLQLSEKFFGFKDFNQFLNEHHNQFVATDPLKNFILLARDETQVREFYNSTVSFKVVNNFLISILKNSRLKAERLLLFIKKEYHLE